MYMTVFVLLRVLSLSLTITIFNYDILAVGLFGFTLFGISVLPVP